MLFNDSEVRERSNNYLYVVLQVVLKERFIGTGSSNLFELENIINKQAQKGYRLHTITTTNGGSKGFGEGDRIQAALVFKKHIKSIFIYLKISAMYYYIALY